MIKSKRFCLVFTIFSFIFAIEFVKRLFLIFLQIYIKTFIQRNIKTKFNYGNKETYKKSGRQTN